MREIVTIQLGSISNHVGTHFWNAQDEYFNYTNNDEINHEVLYRQGETVSGTLTYTPRALIYDLKDGFGSLQKYNRLFSGTEDQAQHVLWDQGVNKVNRGISKHRYQQELDRMETENDLNMNDSVVHELDQSVNNWSDYNRIYYHPRTINPIMTHQVDDAVTPFDNYVIGRQAYRENEKEMDTFDENFRFFVEECDSLQGFQILTDIDDAFGGFTESLINEIRDEFAKTPILTYGLSDSKAQYRTDRHKQKIMLNRAFSTTRLTDLSSVFVPIYTPTVSNIKKSGLSPYISFNEHSRYHTSAIIAAAIETNLLPYRLKKNPITLADTINKLNWAKSTKLASLSVSVPLPLSKNEHYKILAQTSNSKPAVPILSLLDRVSTESLDIYGDIAVARGIPAPHEDREELYRDCKDANDPLHSRYAIDCSLPLPNSYPRIFTPIVDEEGYISQTPRFNDKPHLMPVFTHFESGSKLKGTIDQHLENLKNINLDDFHEYTQGDYGLSREDFLETKEELFTLSDTFKSDDDDMMLY